MGIKKQIVGFYQILERLIQSAIGRKRLDTLSQILNLSRIIEVIYLSIFLLLVSGTINFILEGNNPVLAQFIVVPLLRYQNLTETFLNSLTVLMGFGGIYLTHLGGKKIGINKTATIYLFSGLVTLILTVVILMFILVMKQG